MPGFVPTVASQTQYWVVECEARRIHGFPSQDLLDPEPDTASRSG